MIGNIRAGAKDKDGLVVPSSAQNTASHEQHGMMINNTSNNSNNTIVNTSHLPTIEPYASIVIHNQAIYAPHQSSKDDFSSNNSTSVGAVSDDGNNDSDEDESEEMKNDVTVVGINGKGKVLAHR